MVKLGRVSMSIIRKNNMIRYWFKILRTEENALPLVVYRMLKLDVDNSITYNGANLAFQIKTILETHVFF